MTEPDDKQEEAAAGQPAEPTDAELREQLEQHFREQKVEDLLMQFMVSLSSLAFVKMGLSEETKEVKDLEQARMAIDAFKGLLDAVGAGFDGQDQEALTGALASMQMTFVKASEA